MKRIISLALLALGMHVSMYAQELVIAEQPVKSTGFWFGSDAFGFEYDCYFGELADDGRVAMASRCVDPTGHAEYLAIMVPSPNGFSLEGETAPEFFRKLAAHFQKQYNPDCCDFAKIDGKAYHVTTVVPKDASPEFKSMVTEKCNIKIALCGIMSHMQAHGSMQENISLNTANIDTSAVVSLLAHLPQGNVRSYIGKDSLSGALIMAAAPEGLASKAQAIIFHARTEWVRCIPPYSLDVYPAQLVENAHEVYTALDAQYKEHFEDADYFSAPITLITH